ncbi:MAG: L,D-transpeptidase family protein [Enhydrobacter sp.]|nr:L,D-transpeptidase family protein [Enhydrobacter sp.]
MSTPRTNRSLPAYFVRLLAATGVAFLALACTTDDRPIRGAAPPLAEASLHEGSGTRPVPAPGKSVLVDIAAFELVALQDGLPVFRSRVIVGRPGTPTPELTSNMYAVKFNPSWTPTPAMIRNEGARYTPPGPRNPLGRILFELDNDQLIYLHDTNDRSLFKRDDRALSHGCVRVEEARQLASWALDVPLAAVDEMISRGSTFSVMLPAPIPVKLSNAGSRQARPSGEACAGRSTYPVASSQMP